MTGRFGRRVRLRTVAAGATLVLLFAARAFEQDVSTNFGQGAASGDGLTERVIQIIALLMVLSLALSRARSSRATGRSASFNQGTASLSSLPHGEADARKRGVRGYRLIES